MGFGYGIFMNHVSVGACKRCILACSVASSIDDLSRVLINFAPSIQILPETEGGRRKRVKEHDEMALDNTVIPMCRKW